MEKLHPFTKTEDKCIERIIAEPDVHINHMVLPYGTALPDHVSNAPVWMTVIRGQVTLELAGREPRTVEAGNIVEIEMGTPMKVRNEAPETLEFFVVKAPGPDRINT